MALRANRLASFATLALLATAPSMLVACGSKSEDPPDGRVQGQTEFVSAPPGGTNGGGSRGSTTDEAAPGAGGANAAPAPGGSFGSPTTPARQVEETDLYRLAGDRLYYLNSYRGLMVFDVSDVAHPKLLGRSPIYGHPVEMIVRNGVASVVVADWYGKMEDGTPFHGSIVRGIDANDPANMKITGEARLGGWVRDTRVVGDVIYAVSEDYGWHYGYEEGYADGVASNRGSKVVVSAVSFANGTVKQTGKHEVPGYGGVFHVTASAIMFAHDVTTNTNGYEQPNGQTELQYIDISDAAGSIVPRGRITVNGRVQGWGADNGRWNLDFADLSHAHTIGNTNYYGGNESKYILATVDFSNPDAPTTVNELSINGPGWIPAARFSGNRMYLSPSNGYWYNGTEAKSPVQIYDLSVPTAPKLAGQTEIAGNVWLFMPSGDKLFALGNEYVQTSGPSYYDQSKVSLRYIDVANPAAPHVIGTSTFGEGWAWTPAAGTFKAFTKDDAQGLVVLPFSGWSNKSHSYQNGMQLIEYSPTSITTSGVAQTKGWTERGIFVKGKLVSLSDLALSVVDYADRANPKVIAEVTLARNVVDAHPHGTTISQTSSDWWDNDLDKSELRVLPIGDAEENKSLDGALAKVDLEGYNARTFRNGDLAYVVTNTREKTTCTNQNGGGGAPYPGGDGGGTAECYKQTQKVTVVDMAGGTAKVRGTIKLPTVEGNSYYGWGYWGCYYYDWFNGADVVQVGTDALAFRRWQPVYSYEPGGGLRYVESQASLYVVDLKNADAPSIASTAITTDPYGWWGNMRVAGNTLYVTHYDWIYRPDNTSPSGTKSSVKYYLDPIDLSNRAAPKIGARINVPGIMVGASQTDPSLVYFVDYRWYGDTAKDEFSIAKIDSGKAYLQGQVVLDGWVGQVFVQGDKAVTSAQRYYYPNDTYRGPTVQLHEIDATNPKAPIDRVSTEKKGWGWLLGVEGDRAVVTSGWSGAGVDVYKLSNGAAPVFDQFVRTRGWWTNSLSRQGDQLFLASGYWGVQTINLK